ncbi:MAG: hypothetical protein ICV66_05635 [Chitinophagaceae bacterium]|nr:hypothetical protein [Chitinophagaceae bacterium]
MLTTACIIAFIVYFIKATTWKGMIFHEITNKLEFLPEFVRKPLYECPICMTPWWGVVIYLIGHYVNLPEFGELTVQRVVFTVLVAAGINTVVLIFNRIYDTLYTHDEENK